MKAERYSDSALPYLTADVGGTGGVIKRFDEDFVVEEVPAYPASGKGTHTYLTIEKRGITTLAALRLIARALHRKPHTVGYAGMKDAHGVTRQRLSVEHVDPATVKSLEFGRIRVLQVERHTNKIKLGHLAGNRFQVRIRDMAPESLSMGQAVIEQLRARGVPNYFGPQRFGARGDNAHVGRAVLKGDYAAALDLILGRPNEFDQPDVRRARELYDAGDLEAAEQAWPHGFADSARLCHAVAQADRDWREAWRAVQHSLRKLYVSAVQSELFNRVLAKRIDTMHQVWIGDIAWKHKNGATFLVDDALKEQLRCDSFEISPTGPLFGRKMKSAQGVAGPLEAEILADSGLTEEQMRGQEGSGVDGTRRPLRVPLGECSLAEGDDEHGRYLQVNFQLPPGAYATSVIREVCKAR